MMKLRRLSLLTAFTITASGCAPQMPSAPVTSDRPSLEASPEEVQAYLRPLASRLAHRPLSEDERQVIDMLGPDAIEPIVQAWLEGPAFVAAARNMIEHLLKTSGQQAEIDYDLPGNLAAHIVEKKHPYSMLITADYCVDAHGAKIECDTSAPYVAGVLTTRAYLSANASRFNLRRATTLMNVFSCRGYPMNFGLQPSAYKPSLIPMFQALTPEEQTVEEAQSGFGNGFGCYTCHSQFANHAQLYVKFDSSGLWRSHAHGLQDEYGELGRSIGRFFASHFSDEARSSDEKAQVFGEKVANLREAAVVIAEEAQFLDCAVRRVFEYAFDIDETISAKTDRVLYRNIAQNLRVSGSDDATFQQLFLSVVTDPLIIRAFMDQR
jgi:hypothetical protein